MGIKTKITNKNLPLKYQQYNLIETKDGITDSVYLLDKKYVLKIFENTTKKQVLNEKILLDNLKDLLVPQLIDIFIFNDKQCAVYTQIKGKSLTYPTLEHIKQIGLFLKQFHLKTASLNSQNINLFDTFTLKKTIVKSSNKILLKYFKTINIQLQNDGIIHGDLFLDNAKFEDDQLTGVYDFSEACNGDFLFDLAVVSLSWCFDKNKINKKKVNILINSYNDSIKYLQFIEYIKYALLYYATARYLNGNDHLSLCKKLEEII